MSVGSTPAVEVGTVLAGKYRVDAVLGAGGMGVVVAAQHLQLDEPVALKFLHAEFAKDPETVVRFSREARAAIKIKSEHVVRVMDVGTLDNGAPFMVMEYLQGEDLAALLERQGPLSVPEACDFVLQACEALAEAHVLGIVHRDLKPSNLFLARRNDGTACVKVLDFGISKLISPTGQDAVQMTRTSVSMGSPLYMSPEQMASARDVDIRTDIWSLGAILYELLAGRAPFDGSTLPEICAKILQDRPTDIHATRPDVPPGLDQVISRCLEKHRDARWHNVAEFSNALSLFVGRQSLPLINRISRVVNSAESPSPRQSPVAIAATAPGGATSAQQTQPAMSRTAGSPRTGAATAIAVSAALGIVLLVGIVVLGVRGRKAPIQAIVAGVPCASGLSLPATPSAEPAASVGPVVSATASASKQRTPTAAGSTSAKAPVASASPVHAPPKPSGPDDGLDHFTDNH